MDRLFSPWRLRYVTSEGRKLAGCVFCRAIRGRRDRAHLVLHRGRSNFVILNKYPYNNGHLMIVPFAHQASPGESSEEALVELMQLVVRCERALGAAYHPAGINLGMNLGRSAGAGIEGHYHLHLVPRWEGDTNFMTVVHGTRVIPESLDITYRRLQRLLREGGRASARRRRAAAGERGRRR
ncbi:MAG TPA: HIT domain-containing protein [Candidatus Cryosericum sp.]|nr:HIT domain-containing protein [Candidatus Cryosericum sp.]